MSDKINNYGSYFDGHYTDSKLTPEEREKKLIQSLEESKKLTEWPEPSV